MVYKNYFCNSSDIVGNAFQNKVNFLKVTMLSKVQLQNKLCVMLKNSFFISLFSNTITKLILQFHQKMFNNFLIIHWNWFVKKLGIKDKILLEIYMFNEIT